MIRQLLVFGRSAGSSLLLVAFAIGGVVAPFVHQTVEALHDEEVLEYHVRNHVDGDVEGDTWNAPCDDDPLHDHTLCAVCQGVTSTAPAEGAASLFVDQTDLRAMHTACVQGVRTVSTTIRGPPAA